MASHSIKLKEFMTSKKAFTLLCVVTLPLAILYTNYAINSRALPSIPESTMVPPLVNVTPVKQQLHKLYFSGNGQAEPHFSLALSTEISGRVNSITHKLENGQQVKKGDILALIDPTQYKQQLASAELALAQAHIALLQEQREAAQAQEEWHRAALGDEPSSPLVLREPQLAAARANVKQAKAMLTDAKQDLGLTKITAPFNAVVVNRQISPGQYLQAGEQIATLFSTDKIDVRISMPLPQWQLLPKAENLINKQSVTLTDSYGNSWQGTISRIEKHIDINSRQKSFIVSVENPLQQEPPLLAGAFLEASFSIENPSALLAIPASSLTAEGEVWHIEHDSQLSRFKAEIVFQHDGVIFIEPLYPNQEKELLVLQTPLPSYIPGQMVSPLLTEQNAEQTSFANNTPSPVKPVNGEPLQ